MRCFTFELQSGTHDGMCIFRLSRVGKETESSGADESPLHSVYEL